VEEKMFGVSNKPLWNEKQKSLFNGTNDDALAWITPNASNKLSGLSQ